MYTVLLQNCLQLYLPMFQKITFRLRNDRYNFRIECPNSPSPSDARYENYQKFIITSLWKWKQSKSWLKFEGVFLWLRRVLIQLIVQTEQLFLFSTSPRPLISFLHNLSLRILRKFSFFNWFISHSEISIVQLKTTFETQSSRNTIASCSLSLSVYLNRCII